MSDLRASESLSGSFFKYVQYFERRLKYTVIYMRLKCLYSGQTHDVLYDK